MPEDRRTGRIDDAPALTSVPKRMLILGESIGMAAEVAHGELH